MIALAIALQIAAVTPAPGVLSIRYSGHTADVATVQQRGISTVPLTELAPVFGLTDSAGIGGWHIVRLGGARYEFADGVPFVRTAAGVMPLAAGAEEREGELLVPYEFFAELLPRLAGDKFVFDPARRELTLLKPGEARPIVAVAAAPGPHRTTTGRPGVKKHRWRVVVDAGHGGVDNGMHGPIGERHWQIKEKDITLSVAKQLAQILKDRGAEVIMTRTTDTLIALSDRGRIANERHGDVFISVHVNAAPIEWSDAQATRGYETYFLREAKTEDAKRVERMENESIRFETSVTASPGDPLAFVITDMAQNEHLRESQELAALIQSGLGTASPGPSRGVFQAGFRVLVTAYMPAVLVEIGFGTNPDEARLLQSKAYQKQIATSIADAALEYLDHYDRRLRGISTGGTGDRPSGSTEPPSP